MASQKSRQSGGQPGAGQAKQPAQDAQPGKQAGQGRQQGGKPGSQGRQQGKPGSQGRQSGKPASQGRQTAKGGGQGQRPASVTMLRDSRGGSDALAPAPAQPAARWLQLTTLVLSLAGLGVSIYLTVAHYTTSVSLICSDKGLVNCEKVTTSAQSMIFGIFPVAVLGLAFYVFMVAVNSPWGWRSRWPAVPWLRLGSVIVGILFVLYLVYAELIVIGNICLWCTSVHVITFLLFALIVFQAMSQSGTSTARR